jgi:hypothetical protein
MVFPLLSLGWSSARLGLRAKSPPFKSVIQPTRIYVILQNLETNQMGGTKVTVVEIHHLQAVDHVLD